MDFLIDCCFVLWFPDISKIPGGGKIISGIKDIYLFFVTGAVLGFGYLVKPLSFRLDNLDNWEKICTMNYRFLG